MPRQDDYTVQFFIGRDGVWGVTFECGPRSQRAMLKDFPMLRRVRDVFLRGRPLRHANKALRPTRHMR